MISFFACLGVCLTLSPCGPSLCHFCVSCFNSYALIPLVSQLCPSLVTQKPNFDGSVRPLVRRSQFDGQCGIDKWNIRGVEPLGIGESEKGKDASLLRMLMPKKNVRFRRQGDECHLMLKT